MALGAVGALLLSGVSPHGSFLADVLPGMLILDLGLGLSAAGVMITAMSGAGEDDAGVVSGLTTTAHELGVAFVLPLLSTAAADRGRGADGRLRRRLHRRRGADGGRGPAHARGAAPRRRRAGRRARVRPPLTAAASAGGTVPA
jgi:hypothetical protein